MQRSSAIAGVLCYRGQHCGGCGRCTVRGEVCGQRRRPAPLFAASVRPRVALEVEPLDHLRGRVPSDGCDLVGRTRPPRRCAPLGASASPGASMAPLICARRGKLRRSRGPWTCSSRPRASLLQAPIRIAAVRQSGGCEGFVAALQRSMLRVTAARRLLSVCNHAMPPLRSWAAACREGVTSKGPLGSGSGSGKARVALPVAVRRWRPLDRRRPGLVPPRHTQVCKLGATSRCRLPVSVKCLGGTGGQD